MLCKQAEEQVQLAMPFEEAKVIRMPIHVGRTSTANEGNPDDRPIRPSPTRAIFGSPHMLKFKAETASPLGSLRLKSPAKQKAGEIQKGEKESPSKRGPKAESGPSAGQSTYLKALSSKMGCKPISKHQSQKIEANDSQFNKKKSMPTSSGAGNTKPSSRSSKLGHKHQTRLQTSMKSITTDAKSKAPQEEHHAASER